MTMAHTIRCRIRTATLLERLGLRPIDESYSKVGGARSPDGYESNTEKVNYRLGSEPSTARVSLHDVGPNTKEGTEVFQN